MAGKVEASTEERVVVRALEVLRGKKGKKVPVGETTEVSKEAADILERKKKAEKVKEV